MFYRDVYSLWKTLADAENRFTPDSGVREPNGELLWIQPDRQAHDRDRDVVGLLLGRGWGEGQTVKATRPLSLPLRQLIRIQFHNVVAGILGTRACWSELEAWKCRGHSRYSQCPREVLSWSGEWLTWITTECSTKNRKIRCQSS